MAFGSVTDNSTNVCLLLINTLFWKKPSDSLPANLFLFLTKWRHTTDALAQNAAAFYGRVHADLNTWSTKAALETEAGRFNNLYSKHFKPNDSEKTGEKFYEAGISQL